MNVNKEILKLVKYGVETGLIDELDSVYVRNRLLGELQLPEFIDEDITGEEIVLNEILDWGRMRSFLTVWL